MMKTRMASSRRHSRGVVLIEVLIAALIFTLGVLGMVGLSALGVGVQSEARYRTDASSLANDLAQRVWLGVDRSSREALALSLATFQHQETEVTGNPCHFTGSDATGNPSVAAWIANAYNAAGTAVGEGAHALPGSASDMFSIAVGSEAEFNRVRIIVCWQNAGDDVPRRHIVETWVN